MTAPKVGDIQVWGYDSPIIYGDNLAPLVADGRLVSRKQYPFLYSLIGMAYADEDNRCCNAELFPLPNLTKEARCKTQTKPVRRATTGLATRRKKKVKVRVTATRRRSRE